jgi:colanic acid biosynthesis protein WcaH
MSNQGWIDEELFEKIQKLMPIASVDILAVHKGKLLLLLRNNGPARDTWFVPGGRVRFGETLEQAATRKLQEETGLTPTKIEKKGVMTHMYPEAHYVTTFFRVEVKTNSVKLNHEHRGKRWVTKIPEDVHPYVRQMIEEARIFT